MQGRLSKLRSKSNGLNTIVHEFSFKVNVAEGWHNTKGQALEFLEKDAGVPNIIRLFDGEITWDNIVFNFAKPEWRHLVFDIEFDEINIIGARLNQLRLKKKVVVGGNGFIYEIDFVFTAESIDLEKFSEFLDQKTVDHNGKNVFLYLELTPTYSGNNIKDASEESDEEDD